LGSGMQVAMRDLELRGAGNLLGAQQHGYINSVGYETYTGLLAEVARELKGEEEALSKPETEIILPVESFLPENYVDEDSIRLGYYRRLATSREAKDIKEVARELVDRFGPMPPAAANLVALAALRRLAAERDIQRISFKGGRLQIEFVRTAKPATGLLARIEKHFGPRLTSVRPGTAKFTVSDWRETMLAELERCLKG